MSSTLVAIRRPLLALLASLALALTMVPGISSAHDDHEHSDSAGNLKGCPPALVKKLKQSGDNFGMGCDLAGGNLAQLDDSDTVLPPGAIASSKNMGLVANIPKQGAFDAEDAFNSDLAFKGKYAFAGNYNGFMVYDIRKPTRPEIVTQVSARARRTTSRSGSNLLFLSVDSSRSDDSCASTSQPATNKEAWEGVRIFDISDPAAPGTSRPWRPRAGRTPTRWPRTTPARTSSSTCRRTARARTSRTASRPTTRSVSSRCRAALRTPRPRGDAGALPRRGHARGGRLQRRPAAATTSPPTRSVTSPRAPAWVTAS